MKIRVLIIIGAALALFGSSIFTILTLETIISPPPTNLPENITPIETEVVMANTFGVYVIYASFFTLIVMGIYSLVDFLKRKIRK